MDLPEQINLNQLIFLSMVLDKNQKQYQDVHKIVSLISDDEISYLATQELITIRDNGDSITYNVTDKVKDFIKPKKDYFDLFYDMYPIYVTRPDGTKGFLRTNVNKCRKLFNTYTGNSQAMAEHLINCLKSEIDKKTTTGKLGYMKTMWKWLCDHQWEEIEAEIQEETKAAKNTYGTELM